MNSLIVCITVFWSCVGLPFKVNPYYTDFTSDHRFFSSEDVDASIAHSLIGQWCAPEKDAVLPLSVAICKIDEITFLTIPSPILNGKTAIVPLKRDALRDGKRVPCWITWLPKDSEMSIDTLRSFGKSGRFGWIEADEDKIKLISTSLRHSECASWFSTTCPIIDPIHISHRRADFWEILSKHKGEMIHDPLNIEWTFNRFHQEDEEAGMSEAILPTDRQTIHEEK